MHQLQTQTLDHYEITAKRIIGKLLIKLNISFGKILRESFQNGGLTLDKWYELSLNYDIVPEYGHHAP